jgi:hypothetical protein
MKFNVEQMASVEAEILKNVRSQPGISRVGLSRKLQIAPSTVGNYTGRLISEGSENLSFGTGRPPIALRLNLGGEQFIGVALSKYISSWRYVPLVAPLAEQFGVPVYLEKHSPLHDLGRVVVWAGTRREVPVKVYRFWRCDGKCVLITREAETPLDGDQRTGENKLRSA